MGCGEVGLNIDYFYSLTPREFDNILAGFRRREESQMRFHCEQNRQLVWAMLLPHQARDKRGKLKKPFNLTDVMQFLWEKQAKEESKKLTTQEAAEIWKRIDEAKAKKNEEDRDIE